MPNLGQPGTPFEKPLEVLHPHSLSVQAAAHVNGVSNQYLGGAPKKIVMGQRTGDKEEVQAISLQRCDSVRK